MKYTKRMILVPEEEFLSLKNKANTKNVKLKTNIDPPTDMQKQFTNMTQDLGKRIRMRDQAEAQITAKQAPQNLNREIVTMTEHLPQPHHHKARLLLAELQAQGFKWTYNKELTTPSGQTLHGSNVVDLIKEALVTARTRQAKPRGWREFITSVAASGIPKTLFTKKSTRTALESESTRQEPQSPFIVQSPFRSPFQTPFQTPRRSEYSPNIEAINWETYN